MADHIQYSYEVRSSHDGDVVESGTSKIPATRSNYRNESIARSQLEQKFPGLADAGSDSYLLLLLLRLRNHNHQNNTPSLLVLHLAPETAEYYK